MTATKVDTTDGKKSNQNEDTIDVGVPTWKFIWGMIRFRPWLYIFNNLSVLTILIGWLAPGLIMREFFNTITGDAPATLTCGP